MTIVNHSEFLSDYIDKHGPGKDAKFDSKESAFASMWDLISAAQAAWKKRNLIIPVVPTSSIIEI